MKRFDFPEQYSYSHLPAKKRQEVNRKLHDIIVSNPPLSQGIAAVFTLLNSFNIYLPGYTFTEKTGRETSEIYFNGYVCKNSLLIITWYDGKLEVAYLS
jgi:hypothetical protein